MNTNAPLSPLIVESEDKWRWDIGNGWGEFSIGDGTEGLAIGVALAGGGAGTVRCWPNGTNQHLIFGNPTSGDVMMIHEAGRVGIGTTSPTNPFEMASGAHVTAGGVWTNASDKNKKENFAPIDRQELLEKIATLSIERWNYKREHESVQHIGPTAQDFHALFGVGTDDKSISTIDPSGIALAAIQELAKETDRLRSELHDLRQIVEELVKQP